MACTWIILDRTVGYVAHFHVQISRLLPSRRPGTVRSCVVRFGRHVFIVLPLFCIMVNVLLIVWTVFKPPAHAAPATAQPSVVFMH
jgi:hypothetical protein